ncbi:MFS transporter, MCP family, solute carrier family 16, member 10 [Exophiala viscosa]|uniref:MFS transporter, MCP family, solute carrier family 16, member 10 n=1 Tax=Exophiala viscosa TaxID=2486360 RepID=A0AAN6E2S7_9EURO|nr:MFS transporter, MCP family, solute carrier family 16, member 10 [Exophiala viscosa]KAI1629356.1 MFS transporter, MCP family, solute carrier family 16, member 10 [Exophiala viscosa]
MSPPDEVELDEPVNGRTPGGRELTGGEANDNPPPDAVAAEDVPPNGGYGWVCTACVFLINAHSWGLNSAWGIFLAHYLSDSTFANASNLEYALIGGLSISSSGLSAPMVSVSQRYFGTQITLLIGTGLLFAALFGASYATEIWHLFLTQGVCFGFALGFLYIPATAVLPQWFSTRRSLAMGIASAGSGLGGLAYNLVAGRIVQELGVDWAYRILAFCGLAVNVVCSFLLKDRNKAVQPIQNAFSYRELANVEVVLLIAWGFFTELGYIVLLYSLPNYATSIGLTAGQGSIVGAVLNLGLGLGRPVVGYYSDVFGRINMAALMTALSGVVCLAIWVPAKNYGVLLLFALTAGCFSGIFWMTITPVTAEVVGLKRLPSSFTVICLVLTLPSTFAEPIALEMVAASGYLSSQIFVGVMFLLAAASTWILRSWKINQIDIKAAREREVDSPDSGQIAAEHAFWLTPRSLLWLGRV